jgi:hypothetical protein
MGHARDRLRIEFLLSGTQILWRGEGRGEEPTKTEVVAERRGGASGTTRRQPREAGQWFNAGGGGDAPTIELGLGGWLAWWLVAAWRGGEVVRGCGGAGGAARGWSEGRRGGGQNRGGWHGVGMERRREKGSRVREALIPNPSVEGAKTIPPIPNVYLFS